MGEGKGVPLGNPVTETHSFCRWHRVAVSVSGDKVTLVADCEPQPTMFSQGPRFVSTAGLTVMGTLDSKEETFEVWNSVAGETEAENGELCLELKLEENREGKYPVFT